MKKNTPEKILRLALIVWFLIAVTCLSVDVATNLWLCSELQTVEKQQVDTLDQIESPNIVRVRQSLYQIILKKRKQIIYVRVKKAGIRDK